MSRISFGLGLAISATSSLVNSIRPPLQKHLGQKIRHPLLQNTLKGIVQVPMHVAVVWMVESTFLPTHPKFWLAVLANAFLNFAAEGLMAIALRLAPLSHTVPFTTLSLPFLVVTSALILQEYPSVQGVIGVTLMCAGAFWLNSISVDKKKGKEPPANGSSDNDKKGSHTLRQRKTKAAVENSQKTETETELKTAQHTSSNVRKGTLLALCVAGLWSLASPLDKVAMAHGTPLQFTMVATFFKCIVNTSCYLYYRSNASPEDFAKETEIKAGAWFYVFSSALAGAVGYCLHGAGAHSIPVVYNSAMRRVGMLVSVLYGAFVFGEHNLQKTLLASSTMIVGVLMIISQPKKLVSSVIITVS